MKIKFSRLQKNHRDFKNVRNLYENAFPDDEKAPFGLLMRKSKKKNVDFWSVSSDGKWVGLLYVVSYLDISYVFYFAVSEDFRGQGIGSKILKALQIHFSGRRIFLAVELVDQNTPNYSERVRRKNFYMRNGFSELNHRLREGSVIYETLGTGGNVSGEEYRQLMASFAGKIAFHFFKTGFID